MTTLPNDVDLAEYIDLIGKCAERLAALTTWVDDHGGIGPDDVNRGDVERMIHIANLLYKAKTFADLVDDLNVKRFAQVQP